MFFACALAIISKHLLRVNGKHIFNPANLGLFAVVVFGQPLTWQIEANSTIIIIVGLYLAYSLKKIPHIAGFGLFFCVLFGLSGLNPSGLVSWFFVFIMLIEPKTSGFGNLRGLAFGGIAAVGSFLVYSFIPRIDLYVGGLFLANLFNPLLDKIKEY